MAIYDTGRVRGKPVTRIHPLRQHLVALQIGLINQEGHIGQAQGGHGSLHLTEKDLGGGYCRFRMRLHLSAQICDPDMRTTCSADVCILKTTRCSVLLAWRERYVCNEKKGVIELCLKTLADGVLCCPQADLPFYHAIP